MEYDDLFNNGLREWVDKLLFTGTRKEKSFLEIMVGRLWKTDKARTTTRYANM